MNQFKEEIKNMYQTDEKDNKSKEKMYKWYNLKIVEDTIAEDIIICEKEQLGQVERFSEKMRANNIKDGTQVAEYIVSAGPAGRVAFKEYTDKECNKGKVLYDFADVWYKIYGKQLLLNKEFTKSELLDISQEIKEGLKSAKYNYIYSIKCRGKNRFKGSKYFGAYLGEDQETIEFEMFDDDINIKANGINLMITIGDKEIGVKDYVVFNGEIEPARKSEIEIKAIEGTQIRRKNKGYSRAKFTKSACMQIIEDCEKKKENKER